MECLFDAPGHSSHNVPSVESGGCSEETPVAVVIIKPMLNIVTSAASHLGYLQPGVI